MKTKPIPNTKQSDTLKIANNYPNARRQRKTYQIKYLQQEETVNSQYRWVIEKLKFIENKKNTYKPIQELVL